MQSANWNASATIYCWKCFQKVRNENSSSIARTHLSLLCAAGAVCPTPSGPPDSGGDQPSPRHQLGAQTPLASLRRIRARPPAENGGSAERFQGEGSRQADPRPPRRLSASL